jgi:DNA-binding transcriptional LysR family regulator
MQQTNLSGLDLNLLVALEALLATRHVTRAAQRLGLSQPAMSHALRRLRAQFADELLVRSRGELVRTARAEAMVAPLAEALRLVQGVVTPPEAIDPFTVERTARLSMADYGELIVLPGLVRRLEREAPRLQVVCAPSGGGDVAALEAGSVDLLLGINPPTVGHLYSQKLFDERFLCAVRQGHALARKRVPAKAFAEQRHLQIAPGGSPGGPLDEALRERGLTRRVVLRVPHFLVAPELLGQTDLVLTAPARVLKKMARRLKLHLFEPPLPLAGFTLVQVWHARDHGDAGHRWLRDAVLRSAGEAA